MTHLLFERTNSVFVLLSVYVETTVLVAEGTKTFFRY